MVTEKKELHPLFQSINFQVKEAARNEQMSRETDEQGLPPFLGQEAKNLLVRNLVRQAPNRIYFDGQGRVCRVLLFSEKDLEYESYMEIVEPAEQPSALDWRTVKSQYFDGASPQDIEKELAFWCTRFDMRYDLLQEPTEVLEVLANSGTEYVHVLRGQRPIYYHYTLTAQGFLTLSLSLTENPHIGTLTKIVQSVPQTVVEYSHPFNKST